MRGAPNFGACEMTFDLESPPMNKVVANADEAVRDIPDGATIMIGGFGLCGIPENLIRALVRKGVKNLFTISNNVGVDGLGNGLLLAAGQIRKHIGSYVGENKLLESMVLEGKLDLQLIPQGTFSERIRAGGAGIPAFYTPAGVGTVVAENKETREFDGRMYVMEHALKADFALVKAWKGDKWGNLVYRKTARNFNPMMATAAKVTIAEVEHLVEVGELDPEHDPHARCLREAHLARRIVRKKNRAENGSPATRQPLTCSVANGQKLTAKSYAQTRQRPRQTRPHRQAHRARTARWLLRQPRHRHAYASRQLRPRRHAR